MSFAHHGHNTTIELTFKKNPYLTAASAGNGKRYTVTAFCKDHKEQIRERTAADRHNIPAVLKANHLTWHKAFSSTPVLEEVT